MSPYSEYIQSKVIEENKLDKEEEPIKPIYETKEEPERKLQRLLREGDTLDKAEWRDKFENYWFQGRNATKEDRNNFFKFNILLKKRVSMTKINIRNLVRNKHLTIGLFAKNL